MNSDFFNVEGLSRLEVEELAFETGFCKRRSGKIEAPDFFRQAYHQRMNDECVIFFEKILEKVMASKYPSEDIDEISGSDGFKRILIQDSTVIRLPLRLFEVFSGVKNAHSAVCNARIQGVYDLLSKKFVQFSIDPYSKNDLSAASDINVEPGDLLLRDRGYFSVPNIQELKSQGADIILRYKHKTTIFDIQRMKAKKESDSKNPSKELPALMSWSIFITTIRTETFTFETFFKLYRLRWRIENIFKTWKSCFSFSKIHNVSEKRLRVLLTARLTMITFIYQRLFSPLYMEIRKISKKRLSLMKFTQYIRKNIELIFKLADIPKLSQKALHAIIRYCTYDLRKRMNFEELLEQIILELNYYHP